MTKENMTPVNIKVIAGCEGKPILGVGVWEPADDLKAVWNVIDWNAVAKGF